MSLSNLMKDTVSLLKKNGEKIDGIKASVQKRKIFINRSDILIETGDLIQRKMSNGGEETYEVIDPCFYERHGGINAHYQMDVRKLGPSETKGINQRVDSLPKDSNNLESVKIPETKNMIKLFISHSSKDKELAEKVTELLKNALHLRSEEIRCTTVDGYRLPGGAKTNDQLKQEIHGCTAFVGLISIAATDSMYVLFELGARWGSDKHLLPLLAPGIPTNILKGPISDYNALSCGNRSQLHQLVQELANILKIKPETPSAYESYIDQILKIKPLTNISSTTTDQIEPSSENHKGLQDDLEFDKASGTYISKKDELRYCTKCLHSSSKKIPLREQQNGWRCNVCGKFYANPNYNPPRTVNDDYDPLGRPWR